MKAGSSSLRTLRVRSAAWSYTLGRRKLGLNGVNLICQDVSLAGGDMPRSRTVGLMIGTTTVDMVIAEFGREVTSKLRTGHGSKEDHLRGPFETMLAAIARSLGLKITSIGETRLP